MTTTKSAPTNVVVVDGSNIATEGRSMPSLTQLNDAVNAFRAEYPDATVTVVVDATFGHRIDKSEIAEFDEAVAHNELVAPPAGAIGRGDAFVLSIANKVGARILTNDSFQEFHGQYPWLFDEGRLIGGKPVPHIGWVFVERLPVKGPASRKSQRAARGSRDAKPSRRVASKAASQPMPVPTSPPPGPRAAPAATAPTAAAPAPGVPAATTGGPAVNDLLPFLDFVEKHPGGSSVNGVVESYSSHGAYVMVDNVHGYVPLRLMAEPPPRSAREVMKVGDAVTLVVVNFAPARCSVDLAVPAMAPGAEVQPTPELEVLVDAVEAVVAPAPARRSSRKATATATEEAPAAASEEEPPVSSEPPPPRRSRAKKAAAATTPGEEVAAAPTRRKRAAPSAASEAEGPAEPERPRRARAKKTAATEPEVSVAAEPAPARRSRARAVAAPSDAAVAPAAAAAKPAKRTAAAGKAVKKTTAERASSTAAMAPDTPAVATAPAPKRTRKAPTRTAAAAVDGAPVEAAPATRARRPRVKT